MRGTGWRCDECGAMEVVEGDRWVTQGQESPPRFWLTLFTSPGEEPVSADRMEFCSTACLHEYTRHRILGAPSRVAGACEATAPGLGDARLDCVLQSGHAGRHHSTDGADWIYHPPGDPS